MKIIRILVMCLVIVMFTSGVLVFMYPAISDYFNQRNCSRIIDSYTQMLEDCDPEQLADEWRRAEEYNADLYEHMIVLTDPFDPNAFPITDEQYEAVLNLDEVMAYVEIPAIKVYLPIYHGTRPETLEKGVGHLENTSLPIGGEDTHAVLSAHCGLPSAVLFTDLDKLREGNLFKIHVLGETLVYQVYATEVVLPDNCSTLYIRKGEDVVTLLTCTPYGENTHRLLVHGRRITLEEAEALAEEEPVIEEEMDWEDWLNIAMIALSILFALIMAVVIIRSRKERQR